MPELPEVETTRRGIDPWVCGKTIASLQVREARLRWPVAPGIDAQVAGQRIVRTERRAKYLFLVFDHGRLMLHLGMSGSLRVLPAGQNEALRKHDHLEWLLNDDTRLRFHDPRRFGSLHWLSGQEPNHPLLSRLGPEPLSDHFDGDYLYALASGRRSSVKSFLMDQQVVVGVGNIYASEALFMAGIHPARAAGRLSRARYQRLSECVKIVLGQAIAQGGTTLRDFVNGDGQPGYFQQSLLVYNREGLPCRQCGAAIRQRRLAQRASYYCAHCQT